MAGLWPFHVPDNAVSWLNSEDGVEFGTHAAIVSANDFVGGHAPDADGVSIEVLLKPAQKRGTIFAFDSSADPRSPLALRQDYRQLILQRYVVDSQGSVIHPWLSVENVFETGKWVFLTITSDKSGVRCYINGTLAKASADPGITPAELSGRMVVGNSTWDDSWIGNIAGLAISARSLDSSEVMRRYQTWISGKGSSLAGDPSLRALYTFSERQGSSVRNWADPATSLIIPAKYFALHKTFLRSVTSQYENLSYIWNRWSVWSALILNILGFVPVGFTFYLYFTSVKPIQHPVVVVVILGFCLSFSIEALQWFLPNRDSGMNDLFTNTGGTALGILLCRWPIVYGLWMKILNFVVPSAAGHLSTRLPYAAAVRDVPPTQEETSIAG